ncbi:MAG: AbiV family abortive infection protein [Candidatus Aenigmarchaeota archaeon]|nr:AbiV family abortive infection protein [Candidatus Aenigmarchaeota archaeon]
MHKQYSDHLTIEEAAKGIQAAIANASSLLRDAQILFDSQRYERACALAILAIEETGKPAILRALLLEKDSSQIRKEWKNYRSHTKKNVHYILPTLVSQGARHLEDFRAIFDKHSDHASTLEYLKQLALYTDSLGECQWSEPAKVVDRDLSKKVLNIAKLLVSKDHAMTSELELELWVKHLKPVWKKDMVQMKQALANCYQEAEDKKVLQGNQKASDMIDFLF